MTLDVKIINGVIIDGTGKPSYKADVGLKGACIEAIGDLSHAESVTTVDAEQCYVCPGFIDVHSHSDVYLLLEPTAPSKLYQGVTTEIVGNCGASAAPLTGAYSLPSDWREKLWSFKWSSVAEYRQAWESASPVINTALLIGHSDIRAGIVGYEPRAADSAEIKNMCQLLELALEEGGIGLSTGLVYSPGMYAAAEEVVQLASVVAKCEGVYTSHMRSEGSHLLEAIAETIDVGRQSGCRVEISHLKAAGRPNWHKMDQAIKLIKDAREKEHLEVAADRYPYTASCTDLDIILPEWASGGGRERVLQRLRNATDRLRIRDELKASKDDDYWASIMIGTTHHPDNYIFKGVYLSVVAEKLDMDLVDAALYLMDSDELYTGAIFFGMSEENMWKVLMEPYVMIGSDASLRSLTGPLSHDFPHPRAYGTFPRFIRMILDSGKMNVEEAVRKMTSLPADHFRLKWRGRLEKGYYGDVVILDPARLCEKSTYENPHQLAEGVEYVFVNGGLTLEKGKITAHRKGHFLHSGS